MDKHKMTSSQKKDKDLFSGDPGVSSRTRLKEQIEAIEKEIRETPYHKGTEHHIGMLKSKLARLRDQQISPGGKGTGGGGLGFMVKKSGDATCLLFGPPSVGKSSLLNSVSNANSKVGAYDFTTLKVIPGMMSYRGAKIQILDVPGIIELAFEGKGGGKQILSTARTADLILIIVDKKRLDWADKVVNQLYEVGIRLNSKPKKIQIIKTMRGSIDVIDPFGSFDKELIVKMANDFGLKNARIFIGEKIENIDEIIDAFSANRSYINSLFVINKADELTRKDREKIEKKFKDNFVVVSAKDGENISKLKKMIWQKLQFIRVYMKETKQTQPDYTEPLIMKQGDTLKDLVNTLPGEWEAKFGYVWGKKAKFPGQKINLRYEIEDEDEIYLEK
jgi:hypothetical protein